MCKIMVLKGIENSELALKFMQAVAPEMSIGNQDGIGYSAINSQNKLFMEKWHYNSQFLNTENVLTEKVIEDLNPHMEALSKYMKVPSLSVNYASYGEVTRNDLKTVTMHTRFATCGKTFENTHPFIENDISLIHNGVISNAELLKLNKSSTCDSENALQLYNNMGLNLQNTDDITLYQDFLDQLKGYWAFAFLAKNIEGIYQLDIVREGASLYFSNLPELGPECAVLATTKDIIEKGVKELGLPKREQIFLLKEGNYHRFNALTGEIIDNFQLEDSLKNATSYSYSKAYGYGKKKYSTKKDSETNFDMIDDIYESYKQTQVNDDSLEMFFDTKEPLIDRLVSYDYMVGNTKFAEIYEDLPKETRAFILGREFSGAITFTEILVLLEAYGKNNNLRDLWNVYRLKKKVG